MLVLVDTNFPELVDPRSESLAYDKLQETLDGFLSGTISHTAM